MVLYYVLKPMKIKISYSKSDEEARYHDLFMAYVGKFIFIRSNPDKYKDQNGKFCNPIFFNRLTILEE